MCQKKKGRPAKSGIKGGGRNWDWKANVAQTQGGPVANWRVRENKKRLSEKPAEPYTIKIKKLLGHNGQ